LSEMLWPGKTQRQAHTLMAGLYMSST